MPSKGSARHALGSCTECRFTKLPSGCRNGAACPFCHFPHDVSKVHRPSKGVRAGYKRSVKQIAESDLTEEMFIIFDRFEAILSSFHLCLRPLFKSFSMLFLGHVRGEEDEKLEAYKKMAARSPYTRRLLKAMVPDIDDLIEGHELAPRVPGLQVAEPQLGASKISL